MSLITIATVKDLHSLESETGVSWGGDKKHLD